jgi:hypothetical protein
MIFSRRRVGLWLPSILFFGLGLDEAHFWV